MVVDNLSSIAHAAVADPNDVEVTCFPQFVTVGKCFFIRVRKLCPILLVTFLLYGGLNQRMLFRFLFFFFVGSVGS